MRALFIILFCVAIIQAPAQQSPFVKFGKVTADHLQVKQYALDSNASAMVLSDIGHVSIKGNKNSSFSLYFVHHKVVHILKKDGYDMADIEIPLFKDGETIEKLEKIKAVTYNLESGKLVESKLDKSGIFTNKLDKKWEIRKFTMPKVKEGSIIEIEYEVSSDFLRHVDPWNFQGRSPRLWSEFIFSAPSFFTYTFLRHGYQDLFFEDRKDKVENFTVNVASRIGYVSNPETVNFTAGVTEYRWVMKDVPGLKPESFNSSLENHTSRIEFQLSSQREPLEPRSYIENWSDLTRELDASESFGQNYNERDHWMPSNFIQMLSAPRPALAKAVMIYEYVRDGFNCTGNRGIYVGAPLKNVVKTKKGTTAELNLMLTGLLRSAGYVAYPVIISTRPNGFAYQEYASLAQFNYVIVQLELGGKKYYLDGSHPMLGFGKLLPECYNGHARIVDQDATPVYFEPDSVVEKKVVIVLMRNGKHDRWEGSMKKFPGYFESFNIRQKIRESGEKDFFDQEVKEIETDVKISRSKIDSLNNYNESLSLEYAFELVDKREDIIYFNPLFGEGFKKNPFESLVRHYPVEMPYLIDHTFILNLDIPEGYMVDELPQQLLVKVDQEGSGQFEYRIMQTAQTISLRMVLRFSKTNFAPEEYGNLREFFGMVTAKQAEHIVFKKK